MLPYQAFANYDYNLPMLRLADGVNNNEGRLLVQFRDRWRALCTQQTKFVKKVLRGCSRTVEALADLHAFLYETDTLSHKKPLNNFFEFLLDQKARQ